MNCDVYFSVVSFFFSSFFNHLRFFTDRPASDRTERFFFLVFDFLWERMYSWLAMVYSLYWYFIYLFSVDRLTGDLGDYGIVGAFVWGEGRGRLLGSSDFDFMQASFDFDFWFLELFTVISQFPQISPLSALFFFRGFFLYIWGIKCGRGGTDEGAHLWPFLIFLYIHINLDAAMQKK